MTSFQTHFGTPSFLVHAPGRINLIGEHTDYNDGYVCPAAIDKGIVFALGPSPDSTCHLVSLDMEEEYEFDIQSPTPSSLSWANYLIGVVAFLQEAGHSLQGFRCVFGGDIPVGAGLSSSAALECGLAYGLTQLFNLEIPRMDLAFIAQKAEHTYAGVQCGIMDQFASLFGKSGQFVRLDCRSMEYSYFPLTDPEYQFLLCNTRVSHSLASTEYNTRRQECEAGVQVLQAHYPEVKSLRDATSSMLGTCQSDMDPVVFQRCMFVVEENHRVLEAGKALDSGNLSRLGELLYASHDGLQHKYEVSCPELDFLVEKSRSMPEILGARMMGGGFGGCTINLVHASAMESASATLKEAYVQQFQREPGQYIVNISDGVRVLS